MFKIRTVPLKQGPAVAMAVIGMCAEFCRVIEEAAVCSSQGHRGSEV